MPNIKSAEKRVKTTEIRRQRNKSVKSSLRTALKKLETPSTGAATETLTEAYSALDKAAAKGAIHKNKAARAKSRLAKKVAAEA